MSAALLLSSSPPSVCGVLFRMTNYGRAPIPIVSSVACLSKSRKAWLCDVWGVLHDGMTAFKPALRACQEFRKRGGQVILISNSPSPSPYVIEHLDRLDVPRECFDALVTSGDVTRALVEAHLGQPVFHLGPERDKGLFKGLPLKFVPAAEAAVTVCTGLFNDEYETPQDYDGLLSVLAARNVVMICANPDLVVERGDKLLPCAGALAARYNALGQNVIQAGKPYRPIYDLALQRLEGQVAPAGILAIGDGLDTDIKGAGALGIDAVYIASSVHIRNDDERKHLDSRLLDRILGDRGLRPVAAMTHLNW
jgi:HAD superfamily hydrolase (TIGR01459 family)